jgi:hypothetical protein
LSNIYGGGIINRFLGTLGAVALSAGVVAAPEADAATLLAASVDGNDPFPNALVLEQYDIDSPALAKCDTGTDGLTFDYDCGNWKDGNADGVYDEAFTLTYTDANSFDWTFDPDDVTGTDDLLFPRYVVVKQSNNYEIWELSFGERLGGTIDSDRNDISHVSFYDSMEVIPLPAAGWLLLGGLGGLYAMKRRKRAA